MFSSVSFNPLSFLPVSWGGTTQPDPLAASVVWRVRHLGIGIGLIHLPPALPKLA